MAPCTGASPRCPGALNRAQPSRATGVGQDVVAVDGVREMVRQRRRIGAYGYCRDGAAVLLARGSAVADYPVVWQVPGGGLEQGEDPAAAVVREFAEETGLEVEVTGLRAVVADVVDRPDLGVAMHTDRVIYDVRVVGGALRDEVVGTTDRVDWVAPERLSGLALMPFTAELLGQPAASLPVGVPHELGRRPLDPPAPDVGQRFAAYGLVTDPSGRVLLTLIANGYPGAGRWHLPGGGTDHGEQPAAGLLRELVEESGQLGRIVALLGVGHQYHPAAVGPEGRPMDWHVVRVVYRVVVDVPTEPVVADTGGSTAEARWFVLAGAAALPLTDVASTLLSGAVIDSRRGQMTDVDDSGRV